MRKEPPDLEKHNIASISESRSEPLQSLLALLSSGSAGHLW